MSSGSHETIRLQVPDLDVHELMVLQDLVEEEALDVDVLIEGSGSDLVVYLVGFRYQVLWLGTLLGKALGIRGWLESVFVTRVANRWKPIYQ
jgi:hypothetical protein